MKDLRDAGFTLIEILVTIALLAIVSVGFYQVMFSGTASSDTTRSVVRISEEARLGFNRLLRDTRETTLLNSASPTSYQVFVDFDGNRLAQDPNPNGDLETLTFTWNPSAKTITLNGVTLVQGVDCIRVAGACSQEVFSYSSNLLQYDWNNDGVTTWQELDDAGCGPPMPSAPVGDCDPVDTFDVERGAITNISYAFQVTNDQRTSAFYAEAQLRNRR